MQLSMGIRNERTKIKRRKKTKRGFAQTDNDNVLWIEYEFKKSFSCWSFLLLLLYNKSGAKASMFGKTWCPRGNMAFKGFFRAVCDGFLGWKQKDCCSVAKSWLSLCDTGSVALQAPLSMEFSRQEYWSGLPLPSQRIFPTQGLNPGLLRWRQFFTVWATREGVISTKCQMQGTTRSSTPEDVLHTRGDGSNLPTWAETQSQTPSRVFQGLYSKIFYN